MIEGNGREGYILYCDRCGDIADELFGAFREAVSYKTERDNGWASVKDRHGEWIEICPSCNRPDIIAEIKGEQPPDGKFTGGSSAAFNNVLKALEGL